MEALRNMWERINGNDRDLVVERVLLMAGINHPQVLKAQVLNGCVHGAASAGCIRVFEFEPVAFGGGQHQKVQLGAGMGRPAVVIAGFKRCDDLFQSETLPRCPELWMSLEDSHGAQLEQSVQNPAVADVDLGGLDLPFPEILEPGGKDPDHVGAGEDIKIPASRDLRCPERSGKVRGIPNLSMIMGEHCPKTSQGLCRNCNTELGNIPLKKRAYEVLAPRHAGRFAGGQKRAWKSASHPEGGGLLCSHFPEVKPGEIYESDSPGERFRYTLDQMGRGGTQNKEPGRVMWPIHQNPEQFEQVGPALDFVDNDQPRKSLQRPQRRIQPTDINRVLKIEIGAWFALRDHPRKGCLAALTRTQKSRDGVNAENTGNALERIRARYHGQNIQH